MNSPPRKPALISLLLSIFHSSLSFPYYHFINYSHHCCCISFQFLKWTNFAQKWAPRLCFAQHAFQSFPSIDFKRESFFRLFPLVFQLSLPSFASFPSRLRPCEFSCLYFRISTENFVFLPSEFRNFTPDFSRQTCQFSASIDILPHGFLLKSQVCRFKVVKAIYDFPQVFHGVRF